MSIQEICESIEMMKPLFLVTQEIYDALPKEMIEVGNFYVCNKNLLPKNCGAVIVNDADIKRGFVNELIRKRLSDERKDNQTME